MNMLLPVFLLCTVVIASAKDNIVDVGEHDHYNSWRKSICEKDDQGFYEAMEACFQKEHKVVVGATHNCTKVAYPDSEGNTIPYLNAACKDISIFKKFDECFEEYTEDPDFQKLMEITSEIEECYDTTLQEYGMDKMRDYLKDDTDTSS